MKGSNGEHASPVRRHTARQAMQTPCELGSAGQPPRSLQLAAARVHGAPFALQNLLLCAAGPLEPRGTLRLYAAVAGRAVPRFVGPWATSAVGAGATGAPGHRPHCGSAEPA